MQDQFPFLKGQVLIRGKVLIRLLYSGMQPVAQRGDKRFPVGREFDQRAIRLELLCILLEGKSIARDSQHTDRCPPRRDRQI
jgi:hypothetical protein